MKFDLSTEIPDIELGPITPPHPLRRARDYLGLRLRDLGLITDLSVQCLSNIENWQVIPNLRTVYRIKSVLKKYGIILEYEDFL